MQRPLQIGNLITALQASWFFLRYLYQRIVEDDCLRSAAALTYLSLFALVPLMTVVYTVLSAVPAFGSAGMQIEQFLFSHFVPSTGREIREYLQQFSQQARNLTGIGVIFLAITAYGMLSSIERTMNAIWRAPHRRGGFRSLLRHWSVLSLGPLCMAIALAINTYLLSLRVMFDGVDIFGVHELLLRATPWLLTSAAFTLIYIVVPNCRVRFRDALIGGVIAGLCFELAKKFFAYVLATSYEQVYGTFAVLPLFLMWIYLSWIIVLLGAELVFAVSGYSNRQARNLPDMLVALALLERVWQHHRRGEVIDQRDLLRGRWLLQRYTLPVGRWAKLRDPLVNAGLIKLSDNDELLLGRNLEEFSLWQLAEVLNLAPQPPSPPKGDVEADSIWLQRYREIVQQWRANDTQLLNLPLATLFATVPSARAAASTTPARA